LAQCGQIDLPIPSAAKEHADRLPFYAVPIVQFAQIARQRKSFDLHCFGCAGRALPISVTIPTGGQPVLDGPEAVATKSLRIRVFRAGDQPLERRLNTGNRLHHGLNHALDFVQHVWDRSKINRQAHEFATRLANLIDECAVCGQIRPAPAVDALLRVADDEEPRARIFRAVERQRAHDLALTLIGILKFINEELVNTRADPRGHIGSIAEQEAHFTEQRRKRENTCRSQLRFGGGEWGLERATCGVEQVKIDRNYVLEMQQELANASRELLRAIANSSRLALVEVSLSPLLETTAQSISQALAKPPNEFSEVSAIGRRW